MTKQEIVDKLVEVKKAVNNEQIREATTLLRELNEKYNAAQSTETAFFNQFLLAHNQGGVSADDQEVFTRYTSTATSIQMERSVLLAQAAQYASGVEVDVRSFLEQIEKTQTAESELLDNRRTAESINVPKQLPASIAILGITISSNPVLKGKPTETEITVANAGDEPATGVELALSSDDAVAIDSTSVGVGKVIDQKSVATQITGTESGQFNLKFELSSKNAGEDFESVSSRIVNKQDATKNAKSHIEDMLERLETKSGQNRHQSFRAKLSNADAKLDDALQFTESRKSKQANNMLNTASRILGAFLNQLDSQSKGDKKQRNAEKEAFYLEQRTKAAIDSIERAKQANI